MDVHAFSLVVVHVSVVDCNPNCSNALVGNYVLRRLLTHVQSSIYIWTHADTITHICSLVFSQCRGGFHGTQRRGASLDAPDLYIPKQTIYISEDP